MIYYSAIYFCVKDECIWVWKMCIRSLILNRDRDAYTWVSFDCWQCRADLSELIVCAWASLVLPFFYVGYVFDTADTNYDDKDDMKAIKFACCLLNDLPIWNFWTTRNRNSKCNSKKCVRYTKTCVTYQSFWRAYTNDFWHFS